MAVTFGAAGAGTNSTVTINVAFPAGIVAGTHYLTLTVFSGDPADSTIATPSGWTLLGTEQNTDGSFATADAGPRRATVFGRVADGTESGTVTLSVAGGTGSLIVGRIDRWTKTLAAWDVVGYAAHYELANGTQTTLAFPNVDLAAGDMLRVVTASPDDTQAISGQAFTATGFTFNAFTEQSDTGTTAGNDLRGMTGQATVATGTQATVTVTYTCTQDESCGGVLVRLRDSAGQTVAVGIASETDTGLAITPVGGAGTVAVGIASETDSALAVTPTGTVSVAIGQASETDTALAVTAVGGATSVTLGQASETDTALGITAAPGAATVALGVATETDTALAVTAANGTAPVVIGIATETDEALTVNAAGGTVVVQTGIAAETDTALGVGAAITQQSGGPGMGGYRGLQAIIEVAAAERRAELAAPPAACPNHGDPLEKGPDGVLSCPLGDYVHGFRPPRPPLGMR